MDNLNNQQNNQGDLNFGKLIAMIIGSTIGAGIFTTIGDMAANGAYSGAVLMQSHYHQLPVFFSLTSLSPPVLYEYICLKYSATGILARKWRYSSNLSESR